MLQLRGVIINDKSEQSSDLTVEYCHFTWPEAVLWPFAAWNWYQRMDYIFIAWTDLCECRPLCETYTLRPTSGMCCWIPLGSSDISDVFLLLHFLFFWPDPWQFCLPLILELDGALPASHPFCLMFKGPPSDSTHPLMSSGTATPEATMSASYGMWIYEGQPIITVTLAATGAIRHHATAIYSQDNLCMLSILSIPVLCIFISISCLFGEIDCP